MQLVEQCVHPHTKWLLKNDLMIVFDHKIICGILSIVFFEIWDTVLKVSKDIIKTKIDFHVLFSDWIQIEATERTSPWLVQVEMASKASWLVQVEMASKGSWLAQVEMARKAPWLVQVEMACKDWRQSLGGLSIVLLNGTQ